MKSDQEIELLLEDWLDDEARPMPRDVLESALESVGRTTQTGRRGGPRWLLKRPMRMLSTVALLALVVVAGALAVERLGSLLPGTGSEGEGRLWDPVADWRSAPDQENPSRDSYGNLGAWSYLYGTSSRNDPPSFLLMPNYEGEQAWNQPGMAGTPSFLGEAWNEPALINVFVGLGAANSAIYLHPGAYAALAWTSPVAGEVTIEGVVARPQDPCAEPSGGLLFSVDRGSEPLHTIGLDNGQRADFNLTTTVAIGDSVYFVVDADGDGVCDLTFLQLTIGFE